MTTRRNITDELWKRGNLDYKRNINQLIFNEFVKDSKTTISTGIQHRRIGKTTGLLLTAVEFCLNDKNKRVSFICPRSKMTRTILMPIMRKILKDCPDELIPTWKENNKTWIFPNGSTIQCSGTENGHIGDFQGAVFDLCIIDEAGFCEQLRYTILSVIRPSLITTKGKIIMSTTLHYDEENDFTNFYMESSDTNSVLKLDIIGNPLFDPKQIAEVMNNMSAVNFQREYLCEVEETNV